MQLTPADGPRCPHCGCRDAEIVSQPKQPVPMVARKDGMLAPWWAGGKAICQYCFAEFNFVDSGEDEVDPVDEPDRPITTAPSLIVPQPGIDSYREPEPSPAALRPIACPKCQSPDVKVTSTQKLVRYYRCKACGARFKMVRKPIQRVQ